MDTSSILSTVKSLSERNNQDMFQKDFLLTLDKSMDGLKSLFETRPAEICDRW